MKKALKLAVLEIKWSKFYKSELKQFDKLLGNKC